MALGWYVFSVSGSKEPLHSPTSRPLTVSSVQTADDPCEGLPPMMPPEMWSAFLNAPDPPGGSGDAAITTLCVL